MQKTDRIYVAGHRGLVGSALVRALAQAGYNNLCLRSRAELDLFDARAVAAFFAREKPDYVFLAAARVGGIHVNSSRPGDFIYENLMIQNHVLKAALDARVKKLIFLGSSCIYPRLAPQPIKEEYLLTGSLEPTNSAYALAKIAGIEMCFAFNRQFGSCFIPVMPTNLYGPNDNYDLLSSHVLPALIRKFHLARLAAAGSAAAIAADARRYGPIPPDFFANLQGIARFHGHALQDFSGAAPAAAIAAVDAVQIWGSGRPRREFLYVDDLAEALLFIMREVAVPELLNIGSGRDQTIGELAEIVRRVVGFAGGISFDPGKPDGMPRKILDISRLRARGWEPRVSLTTAIAAAYDAYRQGGN